MASERTPKSGLATSGRFSAFCESSTHTGEVDRGHEVVGPGENPAAAINDFNRFGELKGEMEER
jgi:hypothetical protein